MTIGTLHTHAGPAVDAPSAMTVYRPTIGEMNAKPIAQWRPA